MSEPVSQSQPATLRGAAQDLVEKIDAMYDFDALYPPGTPKDTTYPFCKAEREMKDSRDALRGLLASLPDGQGDESVQIPTEPPRCGKPCILEKGHDFPYLPSSQDNPS